MPHALENKSTLGYLSDNLPGDRFDVVRFRFELGIVGMRIPALKKIGTLVKLYEVAVHAFFREPIDHAGDVLDGARTLDADRAVGMVRLLVDLDAAHPRTPQFRDDFAVAAGAQPAAAAGFEVAIDRKQNAARIGAGQDIAAVRLFDEHPVISRCEATRRLHAKRFAETYGKRRRGGISSHNCLAGGLP